MVEDSPKRHPVATGIEWASRITTVALMMVLPGILGQWLDEKWSTNFLGLTGFALGNVAGIWYLLKMTQILAAGPPSREMKPQDGTISGDKSGDQGSNDSQMST